MSATSGGNGWWLASDGKWYPPELHANYMKPPPDQPVSAPLLPDQSLWTYKPLRYGGKCVSCGRHIEPNEKGWHDSVAKKIMCTTCRPPEEQVATKPVNRPAMTPDPIGGSSQLRESQRRRDTRNRKGAIGEYLMDQVLHRELTGGEVILTDRQVPGSPANIDHVVVAASGVWIIDAKKWEGKIEYKPASLTSPKMRLLVGGEDRTSKIEGIYSLVIPVAQVIGDRSVNIHPALAFVEGEWSTKAMIRLMRSKPYRHEGVWLSAPTVLTKLIKEPVEAPLNPEAISRLGAMLDQALTPR